MPVIAGFDKIKSYHFYGPDKNKYQVSINLEFMRLLVALQGKNLNHLYTRDFHSSSEFSNLFASFFLTVTSMFLGLTL